MEGSSHLAGGVNKDRDGSYPSILLSFRERREEMERDTLYDAFSSSRVESSLE